MGLRNLLARIARRYKRAEECRKKGGSFFRFLKTKLTEENGKLAQDIVITAIQEAKTIEEMKSFYRGYSRDIILNPKKYPKKAREHPYKYAKNDIITALNLHFYNQATHKKWYQALNMRIRKP